MPVTISGDTGIVTPMYNGSITANAVTPSVNMKNRIINGNMSIDQRNAGASVTPTNGSYTLDRWYTGLSQTSKLTIQQNAGSVTPPAGFTNYLGITSSSAYSVISTDYFYVMQVIEGFNTADLAWGTANAKTVTVSFWVRSSLTGTFSGVLQNYNSDRSYPFTYTISSANTWEQKSVTIAGDTTGTWFTNNSGGICLLFSVGAGSSRSGTAGAWAGSAFYAATGATSVVGTNGATWYITGVQLEVGSTATSFDYRPYGTELALCERYFQAFYGNGTSSLGGMGARINAPGAGSGIQANIPLKVTMRTAASGTRVGTWTVTNCGQPSMYSDAEILYVYSSANASGDVFFYTGSSTVGVTVSAEL